MNNSCLPTFIILLLCIITPAYSDLPASRSLLQDLSAWQPVASDGVKIGLTRENSALRIDFDFTAGAGYGGTFLELPLELPENYELTFNIRGEGPANNLELKLVSPDGLDVWWVNRRAFELPAVSKKLINLQRHFQFAWGPSGGTPLKKLGKIELILAAAEGGKGSVWIEDFRFTPRPPVKPYSGTPTIARSAGAIEVDFGEPREIGGVIIKWKDPHAPADLVIESWEAPEKWNRAAELKNVLGAISYVAIPDLQTRNLRLRATKADDIDSIEFLDPQTGSSPNALWRLRASRAAKGVFPRNLLDKQSYWTIIGVPDDDREAIINEEGQIEVDRRGFSIEPFILMDGKLLTWADGRHEQSLRDGWLPMPRVVRTHEMLELTIDALAAGEAAKSQLHAAYTIRNTSAARQTATLALAVRPFQVLPPWQDLNITGGWAPVKSVVAEQGGLRVNDKRQIIASPGFAAAVVTGDQGDAVELLAAGKLPDQASAICTQQSASGMLRWNLELQPGESKSVHISIPFHQDSQPELGDFNTLAIDVAKQWKHRIGKATFQLPEIARQFHDTICATQAYILINHNGKGFQPGSRTYFRSWIRDGSMTSAAMLELGHADLVKRFIDWYAPYQFPSGKVPCVVDRRGSDPVAENDSHGQLLWLIANYHRYTGDTDLVRRHFPRVKAAVEYIESIRAQRLTAEFTSSGSPRQEPGKPPVPALAFRGLVPESISHEGYSAKPMHSFWDSLYTLRGLKDAAYLAKVAGDEELSVKWASLANDFRNSVIESIRLTQQAHGIDYLPGCVELGDFDSTSSTILLWPVDEASRFPSEWTAATFSRYWREFEKRKASQSWEAYTPYELRHIGALIRIGQKDRALQALDFYFSHQRPAGWREWAEVVWRDRDMPRMIGDMPHTWCGSDFLNSARAMFVYEDEAKKQLVLFAGIPEEWCKAKGGVGFSNLRTEAGEISAAIALTAHGGLSIRVSGSARPSGGFEVRSPFAAKIASAKVNGQSATVMENNSIKVDALPADIELRY